MTDHPTGPVGEGSGGSEGEVDAAKGVDRTARRAGEVVGEAATQAKAAASYVTGTSWVVDGGMLQMGPPAGSHLDRDGW